MLSTLPLAFYADRLPHTFDFLVIEKLDYFQIQVGSITVKRTLDAQIALRSRMAPSTAPGSTMLVGCSQLQYIHLYPNVDKISELLSSAVVSGIENGNGNGKGV